MEVASTPIQQQQTQTQQRQPQQQSQAQQQQHPDLLVQKKVITTLTGCPFAHTTHSLSAGPNGPVLLQDRVLFEKIQHFVREKIPPRNVHALGTGAYGELTITNPDLYRFTCAKVFEMGRVTKLFTRLSGIFTDEGEAETVRDPRGFALKFFTSEGNWDLLAINTPVFACRDAKIGPETVHAFKRDPQTGEWNPALSWNFVCEHPEALHQTLMLFTNRVGTPLSWRHMNAFGCNTFSFINANRERFWVKFHLIAELGWKGMASHEAKLIAGEDPDWLSRDLREAIQQRRFPKWKFCFQMMPEAEGYNNPIAFDATKIWPHADYPLIDIGTIELNQNPIDYFAEVDQVAFSPLNVVPGIGFSPDKLLQGRLLIYDDAQTHRLGPNFKQIPINQPHGNLEAYRYDRNYVLHFGGSHQMEIRDQKRSVLQGSEPLIGIGAGLAAKGTESRGAGGFGGGAGKQVGDVDVGIGAGSQKTASSCYFEPPLVCDGPADFYTLPGEGSDKDLYAQCREFLKSIDQKEFPDLIENLAMNFCKINQTEYPDLITKIITHFQRIDKDFANWVKNRYQEMCSVDPITSKTEGQLTWMRLKKKLRGGEKEKGEEEKTGTL